MFLRHSAAEHAKFQRLVIGQRMQYSNAILHSRRHESIRNFRCFLTAQVGVKISKFTLKILIVCRIKAKSIPLDSAAGSVGFQSMAKN